MKIKFKDYEIDLSVVELKELSTSYKSSTHKVLLVDSSSKSSVKVIPVKPKTDTSQNPKKLDNEKIRQIKNLAKEGLSNNEIGKRLNISPQLANYWRKNTPKDYGGNNGLV